MKHRSKDQTRLIDKALSKGFRNKPKKQGGLLLPPDKNKEGFLWHYGEKGFHDLRRYLEDFSIYP